MFGMQDISKCSNNKCPFRKNCWRWECPASGWQSYSEYPTPKKEADCDGYYPMSKNEIERLKKKLAK